MLHALFDEVGEVIHIGLLHIGSSHIPAQHFTRNRMKQQTRGSVGVVWVFFNQGPRRQNGGFVHLIDRHAVVQITQRLGDDGVGLDFRTQARAGIADTLSQGLHIQGHALTTIDHMQGRRS